jgi:hypothetical protein
MRGNPLIEFFILIALWAILWIPLSSLNHSKAIGDISSDSDTITDASNKEMASVDCWIEIKSSSKFNKLVIKQNNNILYEGRPNSSDYIDATIILPASDDLEKVPVSIHIEWNQDSKDWYSAELSFEVLSLQSQKFNLWSDRAELSRTVQLQIKNANN